MSDTHPNDAVEHAPQSSPGELLRREREALDLSREEVAAALNLRPAVIDGLERDDYAEVPIATYRRGYLRSYANLLGLDEHRVLGAYRAHFGSSEATEQRVTPVHVVNRPPSRLGAWLFRLVTLAVVAGLAGLTLMWWQSRGGSEPPSPADSGPVAVDRLDGTTTITAGGEGAAGGVAPDADVVPPAPAAPASPGTASEPATGAAPQTETAAAEAATSADPTASAGPSEPAAVDAGDAAESTAAEDTQDAPAADPRVLELTFNEQSWTEIFDASNQRVFVGLQEPGTTARVEGTPPFRMTVGNATGVELRWRGEAVDLAPRTGANNVARFTLGE